MVRIRHSDSVKIQISGPRRVIPHTRIEIGRRSMTWNQFIVDVCGIKLDSKQEYFICTAGYSPNHSIEGWTACLNDPIELFVQNYTKKLKKYSVRLHRGSAPQKIEDPQILASESSPQNEIRLQNNNGLVHSSPQKPITSLAAKKFASISPLKPSQLAELIFEQNIEKNLVEQQQLANSPTPSPLKRKRGRKPKNKATNSWTHSVRVSDTKLVVKRSESIIKQEASPPKLMRFDETEKKNINKSSSNVGKVNGRSKMSTHFNIKREQDETMITDLLELGDDDEDIEFQNVEYDQESSSIEDRFSEGECKFNRLVESNKYENAGDVIKKEKKESGPEMQDLMTRFEQCIDNFDEGLLEQIKLEVSNLRTNGKWENNMKRSPLACYLIEEICRA